ncbi:ATP-binding response regulator [Quisquiliibacterium transsilvanicum]|uniref:histidine kinase n=1 Tax=Quisquiliibacterium transsilvanicum TaxID=1549638 RepID=A0A7W8HKP8_9BURK|nr:histidine kinase [Quisquiliibacterium transsilvanicum]MBB5273857.1 signal transduction histidine kinase [Quisquiliibacterium transsilvanicum]
MSSPDQAAQLRLIAVEDSADDVELLRLALLRHGMRFTLRSALDEQGFLVALSDPVDAVLCDYSLPAFSPYRALELIRSVQPEVPLIVLTRAVGEEAAVALLRAGACDFFLKNRIDLVPAGLERVLRERRLERERRRVQVQLEQAYSRLSRVSARLVDAQERERAWIARELHDELGQTLAGVVLQLGAAQRSADPGQARENLQAALTLSRSAMEQVRSMSFSLKPPQLELLGLSATVRGAAERLLDPAGVHGRFEVRGAEPRDGSPRWIAVVRVAQEAVLNAIRHAAPAKVLVRLHFHPEGALTLIVADDGCGFDVAGTLAGGPSDENFGLYGMIERAELAGGRLRLVSRQGRGSCAILRFPATDEHGGHR